MNQLRETLKTLQAKSVAAQLSPTQSYMDFVDQAEAKINKYISEIIGEEDHSPMYFAELFKGQAHDAHLKREGRNELIAEQRLRAGITVDGEKA